MARAFTTAHLSADELTALATAVAEQTPTACWPPGTSASTSPATESPTPDPQLHGQTVTCPPRRHGHNFTGAQTNFNLAPHEYGAIHFHDDDVEDVPGNRTSDLRSRLTCPAASTRPGCGPATTRTICPSASAPPGEQPPPALPCLCPPSPYVVYANFREHRRRVLDKERVPNADPDLHEPEYAFIRANGCPAYTNATPTDRAPPTSLSCAQSSTCGPSSATASGRPPPRFPADLYLIDWLEATGHQVDVITDHDLHAEGADLLSPYRVVLTGSHHEYWTTDMLAGMRSYLNDGGRLMYLGGNGFFGVTTIDAERPHIAEVRRWGTSWPFEMPPAERVHSTTGEPGAEPGATAAYRRMAWSASARAQPASTGAPTTSANPTASIPAPPSYLTASARRSHWRLPLTRRPPRRGGLRDGPSRLRPGHPAPRPAAGLVRGALRTLRRLHRRTSGVHPGQGRHADRRPAPPDRPHVFVRADMVYFETPKRRCRLLRRLHRLARLLSHNSYDNTVSRVTANVLRRFAADR